MDYTTHALAWERDPVITPTGLRSEVASGRMGRWAKYNDPESLTWVNDADGRPVGLTRNQLSCYLAIRELSGTGVRVTMRLLAEQLGVSPSTVWRAMIKLTAFGLVAYQSNRGRNGGTVFLTGALLSGTEYLRDEAKAKIRKWRLAAEARISRLRVNVASLFPGRERELYQYRYVVRSMSATNTAWTAAEIREALGE